MTPLRGEELRNIKTFPQLVRYLREDLEWPIEQEDFDELTFDYAPEELGLDEKAAAKVREIKQLRPLVTGQPWGIFFVNFEPKKLPIGVLRRILRALVIKKRASASKSQMAAWQLHDLLFISAYGESGHRDLTFAHFSDDRGMGDLPALRVLGWDDEDTVFHLADAHKTLKEKLRWPAGVSDLETWRKTWSGAFKLGLGEAVATSKDLAIRLADLAMAIRKRANRILQFESDAGPLRRLHSAFRAALIHDLTEDDFADMYAQTIAYGLLSARISRASGALVADDITHMVPVTNPFLKDLLETFLRAGGRKGGIDFDELGINEIVQTLRAANMEAVLRDFDDRNPQEDPVIHFYELFLKEYDPKKRMQRGVFYTPRPVVSFIIRSVDEILRRDFGLQDGLADTTTWGEIANRHAQLTVPEGTSRDAPFVQILDPAVGTGTFLVEAIELIYETMCAKWRKSGHLELETPNLWNEYVSKHLLPRLYGFELMMAPYAIAHMKIGLKLASTGYKFRSDQRLRVYLTNSLEPPQGTARQYEFLAPALAHEAEAVERVKRSQPATIVVGNPPYSSSTFEGDWIIDLLSAYKRDLNEKKADLNREEWKFFRYSEHVIAKNHAGVFGFISNRSYLDGVAMRRMRQHLTSTYNKVSVVDLHGDVKGRVVESQSGTDENVFEIKQGVAITLGTRSPGCSPTAVTYSSATGPRSRKFDLLLQHSARTLKSQRLDPSDPYFLWTPNQGKPDGAYQAGIPITSLFRAYCSGIQTKRDALTIHYDPSSLVTTVREFCKLTPAAARKQFDLAPDGRDWTIAAAQADLRDHNCDNSYVTGMLYRPFDVRFTFWTGRTKGFLAYPRREVMQHMVGGSNIGIIFNRQITGASVSHFLVTRLPSCHGTFYLGNRGQDYLAPLYLRDDAHLRTTKGPDAGKIPNLDRETLDALLGGLPIRFDSMAAGGLTSTFGPEHVLHYVYAIFHSNAYRSANDEALRIDFPKIPRCKNPELFRALCGLGGELVGLHLLESIDPQRRITRFSGRGDPNVAAGYPTFLNGKAMVNPLRWFEDVSQNVWEFRIGGYQVCEKWLKDRRGRTLSQDDIDHYQKVIMAISGTIRLMSEIDKVIDSHGGWPGAFATN